MRYVIFRVQPINKLKDLEQIGAHNTRTKEAYKSNPDIDKSKSHNNINLVPITHKDYYTSPLYFTLSSWLSNLKMPILLILIIIDYNHTITFVLLLNPSVSPLRYL